ncbi:hypothetical protein KVR01_004093 [Diaporthe batatas]|uniref:uncharacterized protein n=1 Tax=Diaporthe batatas TaxID=748121 RepID=UPI001D05A7CB|nr:uncharacterized protein KVR01_004093 [Diaporthe batatas]KAG8165541.1 hypothetical protein KVR01_004093 [Diaporthe batatas]
MHKGYQASRPVNNCNCNEQPGGFSLSIPFMGAEQKKKTAFHQHCVSSRLQPGRTDVTCHTHVHCIPTNGILKDLNGFRTSESALTGCLEEYHSQDCSGVAGKYGIRQPVASQPWKLPRTHISPLTIIRLIKS